jgi:hypothetical protein
MTSMHNDKAKLEITNLADSQGDKEWWASQSVVSRLQALLELRKIVYGDAVTGRLQRVLEITELR